MDSGKIAFRPAVELSYLTEEEQNSLLDSINSEQSTPSLAQASKMKEFSQNGRLNADVILSIMCEQKPNTGDEISGWHITVYADEACTQELHTLITGQDGTVCIYLEPGTYWVKETGSEDVRDDYWKMDDSVKQLVIRAHEKTTLEFVNNYSGRIAIRKSVEPEGTLEGWKFRITDADGKEVSGSPFTTDKDGKILTGNLTPGEYTVEEVLPTDSLYTGEAPKAVTVVAGKTAEVYRLQPDRLEIRLHQRQKGRRVG